MAGLLKALTCGTGDARGSPPPLRLLASGNGDMGGRCKLCLVRECGDSNFIGGGEVDFLSRTEASEALAVAIFIDDVKVDEGEEVLLKGSKMVE